MLLVLSCDGYRDGTFVSSTIVVYDFKSRNYPLAGRLELMKAIVHWLSVTSVKFQEEVAKRVVSPDLYEDDRLDWGQIMLVRRQNGNITSLRTTSWQFVTKD